MCPVTVADTAVDALFDTGAQGLVVKNWVLEATTTAGLKYQVLPKAHLESVTGEEFPVYKTVRSIPGNTVASKWHVSNAIAYDMVLGMNVIANRQGLCQVQDSRRNLHSMECLHSTAAHV
jgi:hypothetical protein